MPRRQLIMLLASVLLLVIASGVPAFAWAKVQATTMAGDGDFAAAHSPGRMKTDPTLRAGWGHVEEVRRIWPSEWGAPHPVGLSYSVEREQLGLLAGGGRVVVITPYEEPVAAVEVAFGPDSEVSITYDDVNSQVLLLDQGFSELGRMAVGADGAPDVDSLVRFELDHLGLERAGGMDVDAQERQLLIVDSGRSEIIRAQLEPPFELVETIDLAYLDDASLREIAVHPVNGHLFVLGGVKDVLYEFTRQGTLLTVYDVTALELVDARGMDFGPSADLTDEPETVHLFLADSNLADGAPSGTARMWRQLYGAVLEVAVISERSSQCQFNSH